MHVKRLGGRADAPAAAQELLKRFQERGAPLGVVLREPGDGVAVDVADAGVEGHPEEVLVRAELVVARHPALALEDARSEQRVARLLEPRREARRSAADVRDADRRRPAELRVEGAERIEQRLLAR